MIRLAVELEAHQPNHRRRFITDKSTTEHSATHRPNGRLSACLNAGTREH